MIEYDPFGSRIDQIVDTQGSDALGQAEQEQLTEAWEQENRRILARLATDVEELGFTEAYNDVRLTLSRVPEFRESQVAFRNLHWIPDNSAETRQSSGNRLRAVYGQAFLLTSHWQGLTNTYTAPGEHPESIFYMLGLAVEEPDGALAFQQCMTADFDSRDVRSNTPLYYLLGGTRYHQAYEQYAHTQELTSRGDTAQPCAAAFDRRQGDVSTISYALTHPTDLFPIKTPDQAMEDFTQYLELIAQYPLRSKSHEHTAFVERALLEDHAQDLTGLVPTVYSPVLSAYALLDHLTNNATLEAILKNR